VAADWRTRLETDEIRSDTILLALAIPLSCVCRTSDQKPRHAAFKVQELGCGFPIGPDARQQDHCQPGRRSFRFNITEKASESRCRSRSRCSHRDRTISRCGQCPNVVNHSRNSEHKRSQYHVCGNDRRNGWRVLVSEKSGNRH
jgi:hypothetical protein